MTTPRTARMVLQAAILTMACACSELIQAVGQPSSTEGSEDTELTAPPTDDQALTRRQADALRAHGAQRHERARRHELEVQTR